MGKKHSTRFITDESQVPAGYLPLASFTNMRVRRALSDAHKDGRVRAVKLVRHEGDIHTGSVWVHKTDADEFCLSYEQNSFKAVRVNQPSADTQDQDAISAASLRDIESSLRSIVAGHAEIARVLDRIATCLESIATNPSGVHHEMIGSAATYHCDT